MLMLISKGSLMNEDGSDYFETKEVNYEVIPEYDPSYPPLVIGQKIIQKHKLL